jgi:hypothetical protein
MRDALTAKRRERVHHGMSTHDFWKAHQKRQAKRALKRETAKELAPAHFDCQHEECLRDMSDPAPEYANYDPNWDDTPLTDEDYAAMGYT